MPRALSAAGLFEGFDAGFAASGGIDDFQAAVWQKARALVIQRGKRGGGLRHVGQDDAAAHGVFAVEQFGSGKPALPVRAQIAAAWPVQGDKVGGGVAACAVRELVRAAVISGGNVDGRGVAVPTDFGFVRGGRPFFQAA